jgi:hypothetical protein
MDRMDGRAAVEAAITPTYQQDTKMLSDEELLALIATQQAAVAASERKEDETLQ